MEFNSNSARKGIYETSERIKIHQDISDWRFPGAGRRADSITFFFFFSIRVFSTRRAIGHLITANSRVQRGTHRPSRQIITAKRSPRCRLRRNCLQTFNIGRAGASTQGSRKLTISCGRQGPNRYPVTVLCTPIGLKSATPFSFGQIFARAGENRAIVHHDIPVKTSERIQQKNIAIIIL